MARIGKSWLFVPLVTIGLVGVVFLIYRLSVAEMNSIIENQAYAYASLRAQQTAYSLSTSDWSLEPNDRDRNDEARTLLHALVSEHLNIVMAIVSDEEGRIQYLEYPESEDQPEWLARLGLRDGHHGYDFGVLVNEIRRDRPSLVAETSWLMKGQQTIGSLTVLIDREPRTFDVRPAAMLQTLRLTLLGSGIALLVGIALVVIRRQQIDAQRLREQRDRAEQLAYVGAIAAGLAHEIRNPINALNMQLEMLEEDLEEVQPSTDVASRMRRIRDGLHGVENTVREFLTFANPGEQKPGEIRLRPELDSVSASARDEMRSRARTEVTVPDDLTAWCDAIALRQIVGNLVTNALRAQRGMPAEQAAVRISAVRNPESVDVLVEDAGPGVPPEHHVDVFECFYTTHPDGTGLGLAIGRRLAEMNGGSLELMSRKSVLGGAVFRLRLPTHAPPRG